MAKFNELGFYLSLTEWTEISFYDNQLLVPNSPNHFSPALVVFLILLRSDDLQVFWCMNATAMLNGAAEALHWHFQTLTGHKKPAFKQTWRQLDDVWSLKATISLIRTIAISLEARKVKTILAAKSDQLHTENLEELSTQVLNQRLQADLT